MAKANQVGANPTTPQLECPAGPALEGKVEDQKASAGVCEIRVVSYRVHLQDPDNLSAKWAIDQLRYSGVIADDTQDEVRLVVEPQVRVHHMADERTEMTLTWYDT